MIILGIEPRDLLVGTALTAAICFLLSRSKKNFRFLSWSTLCAVVFAFFMTVIFSLTGISPLSGFGLRNLGGDISIIPFVGIFKMLSDGLDFYSITNVVGNVILFAPVGFFAPLLCKRFDSAAKTMAVGGAISVIIELSQMFLIRGTDIDDVILNTLGTLIGYGCYRVFRRIFPKLCIKVQGSDLAASPLTFVVCTAACYLTVVLLGFYDRMLYFFGVV